MVIINGTPADAAGKTLSAFLCSAGYDTKRIAVEQNGLIVPKEEYDSVTLNDGDKIEIVSFVGGG